MLRASKNVNFLFFLHYDEVIKKKLNNNLLDKEFISIEEEIIISRNKMKAFGSI